MPISVTSLWTFPYALSSTYDPMRTPPLYPTPVGAVYEVLVPFTYTFDEAPLMCNPSTRGVVSYAQMGTNVLPVEVTTSR